MDLSKGTVVEYWGYASRVLPCTNDDGTCQYFEAVYGGHLNSMIYSGIIWSTIGGICLIYAIGRQFWSPQRSEETPLHAPDTKIKDELKPSGMRRLGAAISATIRRYTLPESMRFIFGRVTRLQVLVLGCLTAYLMIFSFVGIMWKTWITPVSSAYDQSLTQKRSWLGPLSDRVGVFAYALTPLSILLASRESILSLLTGIPYHSFIFLHRWLGWIIAMQALIHTIGWTVIETIHYQPQPVVANKWIKQLYMIWGCVASIILFIMVVLATPWGIRLTGYEFFRKAHYVLAMVYIGACWGHWEPLKVFSKICGCYHLAFANVVTAVVPGLAIWLVDRFARLMRTFLIHYNYLPNGSMGFVTAQADMKHFPDPENGDIVRLDFSFPQSWKPGQHFYLCFSNVSIWQSHPFTPLSLSTEEKGVIRHSYVFRAKGGETAKVAKLVATGTIATPVVMQGPYGEDHSLYLSSDVNVLCVAGGTGIAYVLPTLLWLRNQAPNPDRRIMLVWAVRLEQDLEWVREELDDIRSATGHGIEISLHVTREKLDEARPTTTITAEKSAIASSCSVSSGQSKPRHPNLALTLSKFLSRNVRGRTVVYASGPGAMITDLRTSVAKANSGAKVWRGDETASVQLITDNRLE